VSLQHIYNWKVAVVIVTVVAIVVIAVHHLQANRNLSKRKHILKMIEADRVIATEENLERENRRCLETEKSTMSAVTLQRIVEAILAIEGVAAKIIGEKIMFKDVVAVQARDTSRENVVVAAHDNLLACPHDDNTHYCWMDSSVYIRLITGPKALAY
jgi:hypothetical protein